MKQIASCLLGEEIHPLWLTEFYGESEWEITQKALLEAQTHKTIAYLDPFGNLAMQSQKPDLILKPDSLEQAIAMSIEMLQTKIIDLLIIDSLFLLDSEKMGFEESLLKLVKAAEKNEKPVFLLNLDNPIRRLLEKTLNSFFSSRICVG
ncbi:MAG: hypothetical protein WCK49_09025 [Myxococcaceae bacterium]